MEARAFSPGHITTFFVPRGDSSAPPLNRGSLGSGFCIESGVTSVAKAEGPSRAGGGRPTALPFKLSVADNGVRVAHPETTTGALQELVRRAPRGTRLPETLALENAYTLPLGAGFGVSGACALAGALAANQAMQLGLGRADCVAAAHVGEVLALTGLGDVGAQSLGGFEVRTREGPPPAGEVLRPAAPISPVVLVSFGPRPTRAFLTDPRGKERLAAAGIDCLRELTAAPSLEKSVRLGRRFAETLGLVSARAEGLLRALDPVAPASVAMLGDSVFAVGGEAAAVIARRIAPRAFVETTSLTLSGARLL